MLTVLASRIALSVPALAGVVLFAFVLMRVVPGDPAALVAGQLASPDVVARIRVDLGLDQSWLVQFAVYLRQIVTLDLGRSVISNRPVALELLEALGPTAELVASAIVLAVPVGVGLGLAAALYRGSLVDRAVMAVAVAGISLPVFWVAYMLILLFGVHWAVFPFTGRQGPIWTAQGLMGLALPTFAAAFTLVGPIARITRAALLETLEADHIRLARAKGLPEHEVVLRHGLRNALLPIVTLVGLQIGHLLGGTVIIETVFAWPGVGRLVVGAIMNSDYATAQGGLLMIAVGFVMVNLAVDLVYAALDPRLTA